MSTPGSLELAWCCEDPLNVDGSREFHSPPGPDGPPAAAQLILAACRSAASLDHGDFEPIPGGYRVIDANGLALAHVYGQPPAAIAFSDQRLTDDEAEKIARLIVRLPELVELERDRNKAKSRRSPSRCRASQ